MIAEGTVTGGISTLKARYIRGSGLVAREDGQGKAFYLHNGHGDVVELRDNTGNTRLNRYSYDIWGNPTVVEEHIDNPFRYSGEMWDSTTQLQYLRARWYDPSMGRFMNKDTYEGDIANPLLLNLYTYVGHNPLIYKDPSGHIMEGDTSLGLSYIDAMLIYSYTNQFRAAEVVNDRKAMQQYHDKANSIRSKYSSDVTRVIFYEEGDRLGPVPETILYAGKGLADSLGANTSDAGSPQYISNDVADIAYGSGFAAGLLTPGPGGKTKTMYHVTTKARAAEIVNSGILSQSSRFEAGQVFAFTERPTLDQAKLSGAYAWETVVEFQVPYNKFGDIDETLIDSLKSIARVDRGPVFITNAREVGFKKVWYNPTTWFK